jgi:hypothetical protein
MQRKPNKPENLHQYKRPNLNFSFITSFDFGNRLLSNDVPPSLLLSRLPLSSRRRTSSSGSLPLDQPYLRCR